VNYGDPDVPPIPAAALAAEDADRMQRLLARGERVRVRLELEGRTEPDVLSHNVVAEIRGRELPHEIVLIGAHLDSWDVGTGASDDGAGVIATWEAARLIIKAGIRPRRTIRVVLFTNEENGLAGAHAYLTRYRPQAADHVFALEADSGVFEPTSLGFSGSPAARGLVSDIATLLASLGLAEVIQGGGGGDIAPIVDAGRIPAMAYLGNPSRFFVIHHTAADTIERIQPQEVAKAAAAIAVMTYVVADMPERLPR
jgi:carboxypeptidase Q